MWHVTNQKIWHHCLTRLCYWRKMMEQTDETSIPTVRGCSNPRHLSSHTQLHHCSSRWHCHTAGYHTLKPTDSCPKTFQENNPYRCVIAEAMGPDYPVGLVEVHLGTETLYWLLTWQPFMRTCGQLLGSIPDLSVLVSVCLKNLQCERRIMTHAGTRLVCI